MNVSPKAAARGGKYWARLCALPAFSFLLNGAGGVARVKDPSGNWIELSEVQQIVDDAESCIAQLENLAAENLVAASRAAPTAHNEPREFPAMNADLEKILGIMCFECIHFARALRMAGQQIAPKAEAEQAATLHWLLGHYFRSGKTWRAAATADMEQMKAAFEAQQVGGKP